VNEYKNQELADFKKDLRRLKERQRKMSRRREENQA
jgi:hypothetical protein